MFAKKKLIKPLSYNLPLEYSKLSIHERKTVRELYAEKQKDRCWYCSRHLNGTPKAVVQNSYIDKSLFPDGMFNYPVHLHHDHDTDMTLGAVHARCNAYMWQYEGK